MVSQKHTDTPTQRGLVCKQVRAVTNRFLPPIYKTAFNIRRKGGTQNRCGMGNENEVDSKARQPRQAACLPTLSFFFFDKRL